MKRKSLLMMLLVALFVPLAMNAQTRTLNSNVLGSKLEKKTQNETTIKQNRMIKNSPVQFSNLDLRRFNTMSSSNATSGRGTRDAQYELVSSELTDWSGNYILGVDAGSNVYAFNGTVYDAQSDYGSNIAGMTSVTQSSGTISDAGDAAILTVAPVTASGYEGDYTIQINGGNYLGSNGDEGLVIGTSANSADYYWYFYWYSDTDGEALILISEGDDWDTAYGITFYIETDSESTYGGFCTYELSYSGSTFSYYNIGLYKETTSSVYTDCDYEKVTASQSDWSGDYVITYVNNTTAYVLTGKNANGNYGDYTTVTINDNTLANADVAAYNVTIEPVTYNNQTKYTLKLGDNYLGYTGNTTNGNNYLYFATSIPQRTPQQYYWTISYSNNTLTITNVNNTSRVIQWNNTSGSQRFACYTGAQRAITLFKKLTECEPPCSAPTNLASSNVTTTTAQLGWDGEANGYNVRYRTAGYNEAIFADDFENGLGNWTIYTDGDYLSDYFDEGWFAYTASSLNQTTHGGTVCAFSCSWYSSTALSADNWLITPQVALKGTLQFYVRSNYSDQYEVKLSTTGNAESNFTVTLKTLAAAPSSWTLVSLDLSSYNGQPGYIAIHHNFTDGQWLCVDDFGIYETVEPGPWMPNEDGTSASTNSLDLTGLDPETIYEWQVMAECTDGDSDWSSSSTFTTLSTCETPTGLSSADITNNSAALSWTGLADAYDIQYREYDATEPATIILTAHNVWGDGSGYQMLLDADATAYSDSPDISDYSIFEYLIPANADYNASTSNMVADGSVSIQIPAGTYDYFITNPTPGDQVYIAGESGNVGGRKDNYVFGAGKTYEFVVSRYGGGDGVDVTITADWTVVEGETSPYQVTGLNPSTTYEWQVQGADCDNWSAGAYFTTLNGTLVESIEADDVEVVVGGTASITNLVVLPADATNPAVTYTSNDETVATVDENGVVTGVAPGTTTITIAATDGSNVSTTIDVTVNGIDVTGITAEDVEVITGETATISYTVAPNNASDPSVTFTSANTAIATVDGDGVVTGVSAGETTITIASVSNPDITAEITVTVTSNPDAVQFTVNVPANARPGQTITVEAYMAAPTSGNYDGFTSLGVHLYYDNTVFEHTADPTYGAVGNACMLKQFSYPSDGVVRVAFVQPAGSPTTVTGLMFTMEFTVLAEAELGSYTFYVEPMDAANFTCNYNNGQPATQIPYEFTPSTVNVSNSYTKHIIGWASEEEGSNGYNYYLIASPLATNVDPSDVTNMIANTANEYDLYYFDQEGDVNGNEWINHKVVDFELENGKGYLYANKNTVDLIFTGAAPTVNQKQVRLDVKDCSNASGHFVGWNLVGNPFGVTAYIDRDCYKMNEAGSEIIAGSGNSVEPMEGIFVIAETDGEEMTFSKTNSGSNSKVVLNVSDSQGLADRAIVRFGEGSQLPKFQLFGNSTKVYFPEDDQDYAVVRSANENELPVNFKASSNGSYTMSVNVEELDMDYLHLIDNMTGMDVDLLQTPSYTFEATTADSESRFRLVFATVDGVNEHSFGFVNAGGNLCIFGVEGKATVQVIDVLGHVLSSETFSGSYEKHLDVVPGVYMVRLIQGNDVKIQKVVVR